MSDNKEETSWQKWCRETHEHNQKLLREHGGRLPSYHPVVNHSDDNDTNE